jgi:DNA-binding NarL/FixJ family response regulator
MPTTHPADLERIALHDAQTELLNFEHDAAQARARRNQVVLDLFNHGWSATRIAAELGVSRAAADKMRNQAREQA